MSLESATREPLNSAMVAASMFFFSALQIVSCVEVCSLLERIVHPNKLKEDTAFGFVPVGKVQCLPSREKEGVASPGLATCDIIE